MSDGGLTVKLSLLLTEFSRPRSAAIAAMVIFVSSTLLLMLLVFLHSKFRDKIPRYI